MYTHTYTLRGWEVSGSMVGVSLRKMTCVTVAMARMVKSRSADSSSLISRGSKVRASPWLQHGQNVVNVQVHVCTCTEHAATMCTWYIHVHAFLCISCSDCSCIYTFLSHTHTHVHVLLFPTHHPEKMHSDIQFLPTMDLLVRRSTYRSWYTDYSSTHAYMYFHVYFHEEHKEVGACAHKSIAVYKGWPNWGWAHLNFTRNRCPPVLLNRARVGSSRSWNQ